MTALKINKKVVLEAVFLLGIIALTLYSIFHEQDPAAIWACLRGADIRYLIGSIFLVLVFSNVRTKGEGIPLLAVFFCRSFLQCDHTGGFRWAADAVILYEKR